MLVGLLGACFLWAWVFFRALKLLTSEGMWGHAPPWEILKFRRLELLFSAIFQSVFGPKVQSNL